MIRDLELSILEILFNDSRTTPAQIAVMTGHSEEEVAAVIRSLEAQKIILKYTGADQLGSSVEVRSRWRPLIEVRVTPQRDRGLRRHRRADLPLRGGCATVYLMSGGYDLMVMRQGAAA